MLALCKGVAILFYLLMSRRFSEIFLADAYPSMSHPSADPAINAKVARAAGLEVPDPASSRILEIGCGTGHHILSLASRWPDSQCTGIEISPHAVSRARNRLNRARIVNARICEVSLLEFEPECDFDFIIAHGFFSWVEDEEKVGLMDFIAKHLAPNGIAIVSFNVAAGWRERMSVVEKARVIAATGGVDEMSALAILMTASDDISEKAIIADMYAKGAEVLAFDDFAPVMDAWSLGAFRKLTEDNRLRWLGDSVSGEMGSDARDMETKRTFRSEILCRADADLSEKQLPTFPQDKPKTDVPMFPKLNQWRMLCTQEGLPVPDSELKPCKFSTPQLLVMSRMDGTRSHVEIAVYAKQQEPKLDFIAFLKHIAARGMFD